tara:strand:+ start:13511 stop:13867 length:357 start_codon:yes stop_codon:yes gene_type:complete
MFRSGDLFRLVDSYGQALTLRKVTTDGSYNPASGERSGSLTTDYSILGYFYNYSTGLGGNTDEIVRGVRKLLISAQGISIAPDDQDLVIGNGDTVKVVSVTTIFSAGIAICHMCNVQE